MAMIIGKQQCLPDKQIYELGVSGLLHDIGKTKVPASILNKPARLTDEEFAVMKQHSVFGYHMLQERNEFNNDICMAVPVSYTHLNLLCILKVLFTHIMYLLGIDCYFLRNC